MKIIIPGIPVPQARMKHSNKRGFVTTYDPKAKEKTTIRHFLQTCRTVDSFAYPRISFLFHMPIPASIPKKNQEIYNSGRLKHDKKPDVDNLIKLYLDCLDGILIQGDQKVSLGPCVKVYHPEPKTVIWITDTRHMLTPWELDSAFLDVLEPSIPCFSSLDYPSGSESLWFQVRGLFHHKIDLVDEVEPLKQLVEIPSLLESEGRVF
jgi:Holliday junction resolvase RusA-like endonuclease